MLTRSAELWLDRGGTDTRTTAAEADGSSAGPGREGGDKIADVLAATSSTRQRFAGEEKMEQLAFDFGIEIEIKWTNWGIFFSSYGFIEPHGWNPSLREKLSSLITDKVSQGSFSCCNGLTVWNHKFFTLTPSHQGTCITDKTANLNSISQAMALNDHSIQSMTTKLHTHTWWKFQRFSKKKVDKNPLQINSSTNLDVGDVRFVWGRAARLFVVCLPCKAPCYDVIRLVTTGLTNYRADVLRCRFERLHTDFNEYEYLFKDCRGWS